MMIIAKCISVIWMLGVLLMGLHSLIRLVNKGGDPFSLLLAVASFWLVFGLAPVAVTKFAWGFIK